MRARVAVIGSGRGTNARALCEHARDPAAQYDVELVLSTSRSAGIVDVAGEFGVDCCVVDNRETFEVEIISQLEAHRVDVLLLAGLMRHLPTAVIDHLHGHVLNIHPSLLPRHGGKGMYGIHVHRAVLESDESVTGATVHVVTAVYDEGRIVAQKELDLIPGEVPEQLQERVKVLEHALYPEAVDKFCRELHLESVYPDSRA